ncbi:PTS sugar transporter subunit IIA [Halalkalibacter urbisdiaboli]|uniref:PTS sugar transporter subunit IIA n=1 Tax=Halalkalibacter urbisdiaboli TaxID=1960589 RepID=UPI000B44CF32|nr:PTS glucose transporter subunit IIA [Halalkalibacter urbisdiaboli]
MFKKLFGLDKKVETQDIPEQEIILSPLDGKVVSIEDVPDPTFSQKMMGDGFAVEPSNGKVISPATGEIIQIFPTKHAIGIKTLGGLEVLIHIGLETVNMKGEGFTAHVQEGDSIKAGQPLVDFDLELVKEKAASTITPVIITNIDEAVASIEKISKEQLTAGETVLTIKVKR